MLKIETFFNTFRKLVNALASSLYAIKKHKGRKKSRETFFELFMPLCGSKSCEEHDYGMRLDPVEIARNGFGCLPRDNVRG